MIGPVTTDIWDRRVDPERFTLREILAHLADWESVWMERLERMHAEQEPILPDIDEGKLTKQNDYPNADVSNSLQRFRQGRTNLLQALERLEPSEWSRTAYHETRGSLNVQDLAMIILGHDGYHLRQVAEWIEFTK
jgi:uncharacterized damage-inducible protein DinB